MIWLPVIGALAGFLIGMFLLRLPFMPPILSGVIIGMGVFLLMVGVINVGFSWQNILEVFK